jgi:hypothetical protein
LREARAKIIRKDILTKLKALFKTKTLLKNPRNGGTPPRDIRLNINYIRHTVNYNIDVPWPRGHDVRSEASGG